MGALACGTILYEEEPLSTAVHFYWVKTIIAFLSGIPCAILTSLLLNLSWITKSAALSLFLFLSLRSLVYLSSQQLFCSHVLLPLLLLLLLLLPPLAVFRSQQQQQPLFCGLYPFSQGRERKREIREEEEESGWRNNLVVLTQSFLIHFLFSSNTRTPGERKMQGLFNLNWRKHLL